MEGALSTIATAWLPDVDVLTDRLVTAVFTDHPEWTDYRRVPPEDLRDGCCRYLTRVLQLLTDAQPGSAVVEGDPVAGQIGRQRAEQGVPLEVMLRTFRLGGRVVWEALLERASGVPVPPEALGAAATAMWTVVDGLSSALSTSYRHAEAEQLRRDDQRRHALIEEILAGRPVGQRDADRLGLPAGGAYLVVAGDLDVDGTAALTNPQTALAALGVRSVWHARADTLVGLVPLEGPHSRHDTRFVLDRLRPLARGRSTVATTPRGLDGVGLAFELAVLALGTLPTRHIGLVPVEERYPESLLLRSPELAHRLLEDWLGPVLRLPPRERDVLLETLTAWLEADRSAGAAAERLYCHRNTVLNRLHRVSVVVGRELTGRRAYVELSLALSALALPRGTLGG